MTEITEVTGATSEISRGCRMTIGKVAMGFGHKLGSPSLEHRYALVASVEV